MGQGAHAAIGAALQQARSGFDVGWIDQRFVSLHIDHDGVIVESEQVAGFGQPVTAAGMVDPGQHGMHTMRGAGVQDAHIVCGNHPVLGR